MGKQRVQVKHVDGTIKNIVLNPAKFCTIAKVNLLLITALLSQGSIFAKDTKNNIVALINSEKVSMDKQIKTRDSWVLSIDVFADMSCNLL